MNYAEQAKTYAPEIIALRRAFHAHPERAFQEVWTSARIRQELDAYGIPYRVDKFRNVLGFLKGGKPGKSVALRADFDALPITEDTGLPFASENPGMMHACGHDGHVAALLGAAKMLSGNAANLCGTVFFCFQMGEEVCCGAKEMIALLETEGGVDTVIGTHLMPDEPTGTIVTARGAQMAGVLEWELIVTGRGGHGSMPWLSIDPIRPACDIIGKITALSTNFFDNQDPFVVSPCLFQSGTACNIIPEKALIQGTFRFFSETAFNEVPARIAAIARDTAAAYGATAEFRPGNNCRPCLNDIPSVERLEAVARSLGMQTVTMPKPMMATDNVGELLHRFGGVYFFSGCKPPDKPQYAIHHPKYDLDEAALPLNAALLASYAERYLGTGS